MRKIIPTAIILITMAACSSEPEITNKTNETKENRPNIRSTEEILKEIENDENCKFDCKLRIFKLETELRRNGRWTAVSI